MSRIHTFTADTFHSICDGLARTDTDLSAIIQAHGYPPIWTRPNTYETLVHIILEQQVSLASAMASLNKLKEKTGGITAKKIFALSDEELRACYVSRQKAGYIRNLADAIIKRDLILSELQTLPDDAIRTILTGLKGIGNWTTDVYLMFVLQRADIFPAGDLAAVNALRQVKNIPKETPKETIVTIAEAWQPNRTIATMLLWHWYLSC
ncbi:MAG TPA: DNA-3-methyladenine glycosylase 2 family protein [Candidatus Kapabacteria bacterium]|nr:DNA-3-methyladenine glycosylase 2 family protein [Candidatus Kapabacteria bacterium]